MPHPKFLDTLLAELGFLIHEWWDLDVRRESYASWKLHGLSNFETLLCSVGLLLGFMFFQFSFLQQAEGVLSVASVWCLTLASMQQYPVL